MAHGTSGSSVRKVGVEEELLLVDPESGELANAAGHVLREHRTERSDVPPRTASHDLEGELLRHMVETHTDPATDLAETARELREARPTAMVAAEESGLALAAVAAATDRALGQLAVRRRPGYRTRLVAAAGVDAVADQVADTCTEVDDALDVVALTRALVQTCAEADRPEDPWRSDLLRAAWWRAARYGLSGDLVHPVTAERVDAREAVPPFAPGWTTP